MIKNYKSITFIFVTGFISSRGLLGLIRGGLLYVRLKSAIIILSLIFL